MTTTPPNPIHGMPDEGDLLAWIEGEALPRDRELAVARALDANKPLARQIEGMRADRQAIRALAHPACPASVLAAVEAQLQPVLERQMLLDLREGATVNTHPPISIVQPVKKSLVAAFLADRVGRRLAMAAGLLLVVGGVSAWATMNFSAWTKPKPLTIAATDPVRPGSSSKEAQPGAPSPALAKVNVEPETKVAEHANPDAAMRMADSSEHLPTMEPETTIAMMGPEPEFVAEVGDGQISTERALELAREGRLVIRLKVADPSIAAQPSRVADRIRRAESPMWRVAADAPAELAAKLSPSMPEPRQPSASEPEPIRYSGEKQYSSDLAPGMFGPPRPPELPPPPAPKSVYIIQTRLDAQALETLMNAIEGSYGEAAFEESAEPLSLDSAAVPTPASVVWWGQSPAAWTHWASVPVVIDTVR